MDIEKFIEDNCHVECLLGGKKSELYREVSKLITKFGILLLEAHIEHPNKPGYRRHDILNKIKELKKIK